MSKPAMSHASTRWARDQHKTTAFINACVVTPLDSTNLPPVIINILQTLINSTPSDGLIANACLVAVTDMVNIWEMTQTDQYREFFGSLNTASKKRTRLRWIANFLIDMGVTPGNDDLEAIRTNQSKLAKRYASYCKKQSSPVSREYRHLFQFPSPSQPSADPIGPSAQASTSTVTAAAPAQQDEAEALYEAIEEVEVDADGTDREAWVDRVEARVREINRNKGNTSGKVNLSDKNWVSEFSPAIPSGVDITHRETLIASLKSRLVDAAYDHGHGFMRDRAVLESAVESFSQANLVNKSTEQLIIIANLGALHITPTILKRSGLITGEVDVRSRHVIYYKYIPGDRASLGQLKKSTKPKSRAIAKRLHDLLDNHTIPSAIAGLSSAVDFAPTPQTPSLFHIGRYCNRVAARHAGERAEVKGYKADHGARPWIESVVLSPGKAEDIRYYALSIHDDKIGKSWAHSMAFDELLFALLLANPALTNVLWPGLDLPNPPIKPGGRVNPNRDAPDFEGTNAFSGEIAWRVASYQFRADEVTLSCLQRLKYYGQSDPVEYLRAYRPAASNDPSQKLVRGRGRGYAVCWGLNEPFFMPIISSGVRDIHYDPKLIVARVEGDRLILRPAGLYKPDPKVANVPLNYRLYGDVQADKGILRQARNDPVGLIGVQLYSLPDAAAHTYGISASDGTVFLYKKTNRAQYQLQEEASRLLSGLSIPDQAMSDLVLAEDIINERTGSTSRRVRSYQTILPFVPSGTENMPQELANIEAQLYAKYANARTVFQREIRSMPSAADVVDDNAIAEYSSGQSSLIDKVTSARRNWELFREAHGVTYIMPKRVASE